MHADSVPLMIAPQRFETQSIHVDLRSESVRTYKQYQTTDVYFGRSYVGRVDTRRRQTN